MLFRSTHRWEKINSHELYNKIDEAAVGDKIYHSSEKVVEAYWAWGISKWMTLTPDVQFYIDPALNRKSDYDTVISLRASFFF